MKDGDYWVYRGGSHIALMQQLENTSGRIGIIHIDENQKVEEVDAFQKALQEICNKANGDVPNMDTPSGTCGLCGGKGMVPVAASTGTYGIKRDHERRCRRCGGTGRE